VPAIGDQFKGSPQIYPQRHLVDGPLHQGLCYVRVLFQSVA